MQYAKGPGVPHRQSVRHQLNVIIRISISNSARFGVLQGKDIRRQRAHFATIGMIHLHPITTWLAKCAARIEAGKHKPQRNATRSRLKHGSTASPFRRAI